MGVFVVDAHRLGNFLIADAHDARGVLADDFEGFGQRHTAGHAVGEGVGRGGGDDAALLQALGKSVRGAGHHADDLGAQAKQVARLDQAAYARAHADRYVDAIQLVYRFQQLQRIGGDAADQLGVKRRDALVAVQLGQARGLFAGLVKVGAVLDQLGAKGTHRRVLLL
ncbi:hypothetical protein D3C78_371390 [compost metagenome]